MNAFSPDFPRQVFVKDDRKARIPKPHQKLFDIDTRRSKGFYITGSAQGHADTHRRDAIRRGGI